MKRDVMRKEAGFTLIELLVVILIIAILAAIAIPVFLKQREKAWVSQSQAALKNAATAIESYGTGEGGDYSGLEGADSVANNAEYQLLSDNGFKKPSAVGITVATVSGGKEYCITAVHSRLEVGPPAHDWRLSTYNSAGGSPVPADADAC